MNYLPNTSSTRPLVAGFYWVKCRGFMVDRVFQTVVKISTSNLFGEPDPRNSPNTVFWDGENVRIDDERLLSFAGPIPMPEELDNANVHDIAGTSEAIGQDTAQLNEIRKVMDPWIGYHHLSLSDQVRAISDLAQESVSSTIVGLEKAYRAAVIRCADLNNIIAERDRTIAELRSNAVHR